jgi:hypothetical protein
MGLARDIILAIRRPCYPPPPPPPPGRRLADELTPCAGSFRAAGGPGVRVALVQLGHYLGNNVGYLSHDYGSGQGGNNDEDGDDSDEDGGPICWSSRRTRSSRPC